MKAKISAYITGEHISRENPDKVATVQGIVRDDVLREVKNVSDDLMCKSRNGFILVIEYDDVKIINMFNEKQYVTIQGKEFEIHQGVGMEILNTKLEDLFCKHVLSVAGSKGLRLISESEKLGYNWCRWGTHSGHMEREHHKNIINTMIKDDFKNAIRVVACRYNFSDGVYLWSDNLHSTVRHINQKGKDVKLKDVPFYVIDVTDDVPKVYNYNNSLRDNLDDIQGAINCGKLRFERTNSKDLVKVGYTVKDFLSSNPDLLV